jgi:Outer membrane protein beta-barrel domain
VRRTLGVLAGLAALCITSWAQIPGQTPKPELTYPRAELFGGYSYGMTESFNAGHVARPNGWNASLGLNVARWMGFVFEGNGLYGTSKIPRAVPAPFPECPPLCFNGTENTFNVDTKLYNFLVGVQFPYRKPQRFTPFGEVLFGHAGVRGVAHDRDGTKLAETSGGLGLVAGGGVDYNINARWGLRFKADYLQTRLFNKKQDNAIFTVGILIRTVHKKKKTLEDVDQPQP